MLDDTTRDAVLEFQYLVPLAKLLALEGASQSHLKVFKFDGKNIHIEEDIVYKVFLYEDMVSDQRLTVNISNEYAVTKMASSKELKHVAPL